MNQMDTEHQSVRQKTNGRSAEMISVHYGGELQTARMVDVTHRVMELERNYTARYPRERKPRHIPKVLLCCTLVPVTPHGQQKKEEKA